MRTLLLTRGAPGSGKSTWIKDNRLDDFTLSSDKIRLLCSSLELQPDGGYKIAQDSTNDEVTWDVLFKILKQRMNRGEFTIVDATNSRTSDINKYKELADLYRYRVYIVDFSDVPLETCLSQNKQRPEYKQVPDDAIKRIYERCKTQKIPSGISILDKDNLSSLYETPFDASKYSKLVFIGDIHGCYDTLMQYDDFKNGLKDDTEYIFLGDFIDRGDQNTEVLNFLNSIKDYENVCLIEGNHECYTKDTQFLTKNGWKLFDDITDDDELAQVDLNSNKISFAKPLAKIEKTSDNVFSLSSNYVNQKITFGHNVVYENKLIRLSDLDIDNLKSNNFKFSVNNDFNSLNYSDEFLELLIYTIVFGNILYDPESNSTNHKYCIRFELTNSDVIDSVFSILEKNKIKFIAINEKPSSYKKPATKIIKFYGDEAKKIYNLIGVNKLLPNEFMFINNKQYSFIKNILMNIYSSSANDSVLNIESINIKNLYILQTMASLNGDQSILIKVKDKSIDAITKYKLSIYKENSKKQTSKVTVKKIEKQKVCCFQMPLKTLITRLNGFITISGNCYIRNYGNDIGESSKQFETITKPELIKNNFSKKTARKIYNKLHQFSHILYNGLDILACHGGIPNINANLLFLPSRTFIHGSGRYSDCLTVADSWMTQTKNNQYLIHGHRNLDDSDIQEADRVFNLEGHVENGGKLRILELTKDLKWNFIYLDSIQSTVKDKSNKDESPLSKLRNNKLIYEKNLGNNISSFNFTREAFYNKNWNEQTILARGLFLNNITGDIIARSYEKFFKIWEMPFTEISSLRDKIVFPVTAYLKENGFLGILSYLKDKDKLFIASKSTNSGPFTNYFKELLKPYEENILKLYRDNEDMQKYSLVFEVIDIKNDPHIIKYDRSHIVLLDAIENVFNFSKLNYDKLRDIGQSIGIEVKHKEFILNTWDEFYKLYSDLNDYNYKLNGYNIEGFVYEDNTGFMFKQKSKFYDTWKLLRGVSVNVLKNGLFRKEEILITDIQKDFYEFLKKIYNRYHNSENIEYPFNTDIITLREKYFNTNNKDTNGNKTGKGMDTHNI